MPIPMLVAKISKQTLTLVREREPLRVYEISTAKNGVGERIGSGCTPRGHHVIRAKIGASCPVGSVFVGRRATGEIYSSELAERLPKRDWILTRILWLRGREAQNAKCRTLSRAPRAHWRAGRGDAPESNVLKPEA